MQHAWVLAIYNNNIFSDETFYTQSQIMVEKVPEFTFFPPLFDSVHRMFHQKLCFQSPKTFTPKNNIFIEILSSVHFELYPETQSKFLPMLWRFATHTLLHINGHIEYQFSPMLRYFVAIMFFSFTVNIFRGVNPIDREIPLEMIEKSAAAIPGLDLVDDDDRMDVDPQSLVDESKLNIDWPIYFAL